MKYCELFVALGVVFLVLIQDYNTVTAAPEPCFSFHHFPRRQTTEAPKTEEPTTQAEPIKEKKVKKLEKLVQNWLTAPWSSSGWEMQEAPEQSRNMFDTFISSYINFIAYLFNMF
ncbi:uncharacterized protein LOC101736821 isoform X1 [Bombyx mori]|uniref:Uncharacterized protein n=1 Tax=Bombyx mori TaxID=7091 RepID=A0A8R1WR12_BOMMO|nr:uncharacterized protein LOC101736821 isoform X1 [Bombyx mori]